MKATNSNPYRQCDVLRLIKQHGQPLSPAKIRALAMREIGMSSATFWKMWTGKLKESPILEKTDSGYTVNQNAVIEDDPAPVIPPQPLSPAAQAAATMPPLVHNFQDDEFDIMKSDVIKWMTRQPEIMQWLFNRFASRDIIIFDTATKTWRGRNNE